MKQLMIALTLALGLMSMTAQAGNLARGQELAEAVCAACHGMDGNLALVDDYPKIGGQHEDYLAFALRAYRSGDRDNAIMYPFARDLSDQDIRALAAWYARQDGVLRVMRLR
ncbi:MAG: c-type cytochrome [Wenzhouxiangella sp.]